MKFGGHDPSVGRDDSTPRESIDGEPGAPLQHEPFDEGSEPAEASGSRDGVRYVAWTTSGRVRATPVPSRFATWDEYLRAAVMDDANYAWREKWIPRDFESGRLRWTLGYDAPGARYVFVLEADRSYARSRRRERPGARVPEPSPVPPDWHAVARGWARPLVDAPPRAP